MAYKVELGGRPFDKLSHPDTVAQTRVHSRESKLDLLGCWQCTVDKGDDLSDCVHLDARVTLRVVLSVYLVTEQKDVSWVAVDSCFEYEQAFVEQGGQLDGYHLARHHLVLLVLKLKVKGVFVGLIRHDQWQRLRPVSGGFLVD